METRNPKHETHNHPEPRNPKPETHNSKQVLQEKTGSREGLEDGEEEPDVPPNPEREFFIDNLLVRIYFIIVMIKWTGLAPWKVEFPFPALHLPS